MSQQQAPNWLLLSCSGRTLCGKLRGPFILALQLPTAHFSSTLTEISQTLYQRCSALHTQLSRRQHETRELQSSPAASTNLDAMHPKQNLIACDNRSSAVELQNRPGKQKCVAVATWLAC